MELKRLKEALGEYLSSISDRERRIILIGLPIVLLALYGTAVFAPLIGARESYQKKLERLRGEYMSLQPRVEALLKLKQELSPVLKKVERGKSLDAVSYVKTVARMVGLELSGVKVMAGKAQNGIEIDTVAVEFKEAPLDRVIRLAFKLETGSYYFKSDGVHLSDYDENGLVSGKITFLFARRVQ